MPCAGARAAPDAPCAMRQNPVHSFGVPPHACANVLPHWAVASPTIPGHGLLMVQRLTGDYRQRQSRARRHL
jgi:hypothetical protein